MDIASGGGELREGPWWGPDGAFGWVDRKTHFSGSGSGRVKGLINVCRLDETGDIVHISQGETAVGGSCGELVEFFHNGGTG